MRISSVSRAYSDLQEAPDTGPAGRDPGPVKTAGSGRVFSGKLDGSDVFWIFDFGLGRPKGGDGIASDCACMIGVKVMDIFFISLEGTLIAGTAG
jgi:hypothetical protein